VIEWTLIVWLGWADQELVGPPPPPLDPPIPRAQADDPHTLRLRIDHNMKAVVELLRRREVRQSKDVQDDIIADFDKLLAKLVPPETDPNAPSPPPAAGPPPTNEPMPNDQANPRAGQGPSGGSRTQSDANPGQPQPGGGSAGRPRSRNENNLGAPPQAGGTRRQRRTPGPDDSDTRREQVKAESGRSMPNPRPGENRPGPMPGDAEGSPGTNPDQARGATMTPSAPGKPERFSDVARDVWGHLPETMRQEVDHYYRDRFMPRYRELLQQYYSRLAESERKDKK
jgi:hypothetical protein